MLDHSHEFPASPVERLRCGWQAYPLAVLSGALLPFSLSPYNLWPLSLISLLCFAWVIWRKVTKPALFTAISYGIGLYGVGVSWVHVSIYQFGGASLPLAIFLTSLFVIAMALLFALPFAVYGRFFNRTDITAALGFVLLWSVSEWLRTWLFTGFPWLFAGYSFTDNGLNGWAPLVGVNGLGLLASGLISLVIVSLRSHDAHWRWATSILAIALFGGNSLLQYIDWTTPENKTINVAVIQPNIPQEQKWQPWFVEPTLERLDSMSAAYWATSDWVVWPEAAVPQLYYEAQPFLSAMREKAKPYNSSLITGILTLNVDTAKYHNSIIALGEHSRGMYHKQRLVPFGEYVPLEHQLRGLIAFFNLPTSIISAGPPQQNPLLLNDVKLAPFICYEVVYPQLVAIQAKQAEVLITVSNDAWFGDSIGPLQHLQMARMRALETGRFMIRGTNTGVSAIINPHGEITATTPRFSQSSFTGTVVPHTGSTPYMKWGNLPLYIAWLVMLAACLWHSRRQNTI